MNLMTKSLHAAILATALLVSPFVGATSFTDYLENKLVDWLLRGQAFTPPATVYVGLFTAGCSDSAAGTEVTGGSYARVAVASGALSDQVILAGHPSWTARARGRAHHLAGESRSHRASRVARDFAAPAVGRVWRAAA